MGGKRANLSGVGETTEGPTPAPEWIKPRYQFKEYFVRYSPKKKNDVASSGERGKACVGKVGQGAVPEDPLHSLFFVGPLSVQGARRSFSAARQPPLLPVISDLFVINTGGVVVPEKKGYLVGGEGRSDSERSRVRPKRRF